MRTSKAMEPRYLVSSLELAESVFSAYENPEEAQVVRALVAEIRSKQTYVPELELIMTDDDDMPIGYCMFSRFRLNGRFEKELLLLSSVAVKTELQRRHISRDLVEHGFKQAVALGYKAVIVDGNPMNYRSRGFVTSADFGITAHESVGLPAPECLTVIKPIPHGLDGISCQVDYRDHHTLQ